MPDGSAFTDIEAATQMLGVFIGGTETVPKITAQGLWELSRRPDQMAAVRADLDANVPVAREEIIRYCAPAQWFARTVRRPFTIHDTTINPGQRVITLLASANRDEREYPEPDEFIWNRPIERLLAFGRGQHFCLGVHLARLEIAIMVQEWLKRVPDFRDRSPRRHHGRRRVSSGAGTTSRWRSGAVWSYRLVAPYTFERTDIAADDRRRSLPTARFCCGSWPPASAAATCPGSAAPGASCPGHRRRAPRRWTASRSTRSSVR